MKKSYLKGLVIVIGIIGVACFFFAGSSKEITKIEHLQTGESIYTVSTDSVPYTFIDSTEKYKLGDNVK